MATSVFYALAAGHGGSPTDVRTLTDANSVKFHAPLGLPFYNPGEPAIRGDQSVYMRGVAIHQWQWGMLFAQFVYLKTTYCAGGYSGLVTIASRWGSATVYTNYNATMVLPPENTINWVVGSYRLYPQVLVSFINPVAV